jgi:hypothetical protein
MCINSLLYFLNKLFLLFFIFSYISTSHLCLNRVIYVDTFSEHGILNALCACMHNSLSIALNSFSFIFIFFVLLHTAELKCAAEINVYRWWIECETLCAGASVIHIIIIVIIYSDDIAASHHVCFFAFH